MKSTGTSPVFNNNLKDVPSKQEILPTVVIEKLFEKMDTMQKRIEQLENNEKAMKQSIINLIGTDAQLRIKIQDLVCKVDDSKNKDDINDSVVKTSDIGEDAITKRSRTKRQFSGTVAFTAYLDHLVKVGNDQPVVYNRIILNEGNGYSNNT
ncbi:hypothetical protein MAR_026943, partial [Mya arenaria]